MAGGLGAIQGAGPANPPGYTGGVYGPNGQITYPGGGQGGALPQTPYQLATGAGYMWDPVQRTYIKSPASLGGSLNTLATSALGVASGPLMSGVLGGGGLGPLQSAAGVGGGSIGVGGGGAGVVAPGTGGPVNGGAGIPGIGPIDTSAATSAAFGAAKDQSGQEANASLKSLQGLMGAEGLSGSGMEAEGEKGIIENALGEMGSASRANATTQANNALDIAKTNQSAAITQRGQDIAAEEANAQLAEQQAALQASSSLNMLKLALGLLPQLNVSSNTNGGSSVSAGLY